MKKALKQFLERNKDKYKICDYKRKGLPSKYFIVILEKNGKSISGPWPQQLLDNCTVKEFKRIS